MKFSREILTTDLFNEVLPLLKDHYDEIAHYKDIELAPDVERYIQMQAADRIRVFTFREPETDKILGYNVFFVAKNLHYRHSLQAVQDIVFIDKSARKQGWGIKFFAWCDDQLRDEGVDVVYHHIKAAHNFGPLLEKIGYELQDLIYSRRLQR